MTFATFGELKTELADLLDTPEFAAKIPGWVRLAEAYLSRRLRSHEAVRVRNFTLDGERESLPDLYQSMVAFRLTETPRKLVYVSPDQMDDAFDAGAKQAGVPAYYTIIGDDIYVSPRPDGAYQARMIYRERLEPLSSDSDSNWLLEQHPDLYLYASALQAAPYLKDDDRLGMWQAIVNDTIDAINAESRDASAGAHIQTRASLVV